MRSPLNTALDERDAVFEGRRVVPVNLEQLEAVRYMARVDPPVCAALDVMANAIQLEELGMDGIVNDAPKAFAAHVLPRLAAFAREMQYQLTVQGFGVFCIVSVSVDCSGDAFFMERHRAARRELVKRKVLEPHKEHHVEFLVPVAAAEGTYRVVCFEDDTHSCRVVALPLTAGGIGGIGGGIDVHMNANANFMLVPDGASSSSSSSAAATGGGWYSACRTPAFQVLHGSARELPSLIDGSLRSRLASLLRDFTRLDLLKELAMRAAYTRSHPPVVLRHEEKERDAVDVMLDEEFADGLVTNRVQKNKRRRVDLAATQVREARAKLKREQIENVQRTAMAGAPTPISAMRAARERALVHPIADSVVLLAEGTSVGTQPLMPEAPTDVPFFVQYRVSDVARVFGIPQALLGPRGENTSGSGARSTASASTPDDKHNFARTVKGQYGELMDALRDVFVCMHGPDGRTAEFHAPLHISVDIGTLVTLYEINAIELDDLTEEAVRMAGLDHRTSSSRTNTTHRKRRGNGNATITLRTAVQRPLVRPDASSSSSSSRS